MIAWKMTDMAAFELLICYRLQDMMEAVLVAVA